MNRRGFLFGAAAAVAVAPVAARAGPVVAETFGALQAVTAPAGTLGAVSGTWAVKSQAEIFADINRAMFDMWQATPGMAPTSLIAPGWMRDL